MTEAVSLPVPASSHWTWKPERNGIGGGYGGSCTIGPFSFTVVARSRHSDDWELHATVKIAALEMASHSWEVDHLSCTSDGIVAEITKRDVLSQLAETTRRLVAETTRLIEEFDVLSRACPQSRDGADPRTA